MTNSMNGEKFPSSTSLQALVPLRIDGEEDGHFFDLVSKNIVRRGRAVSKEFEHLVGARMKIHFDFGSVTIPSTAESVDLKGSVELCSCWDLPANTLHDSKGYLSTKCRETVQSMLKASGVQTSHSNWGKMMHGSNPYLFAILFLPPTVQMTWNLAAPLLFYNWLGVAVDDMLDSGSEDVQSVTRVAETVNAILNGDQLEVGSETLYLVARMARESWKSHIQDPVSFQSVTDSFTQFIDGMVWNRLKWSGLKGYEWGFATWMKRYLSLGWLTGRDMIGSLCGAKVPPQLLKDPLWIYYEALAGTLAAIYNDITSLHKEVGEDHATNIFISKSICKHPDGAKKELDKILNQRIPFLVEEINAIKPLILLKHKEHSQDVQIMFTALDNFADAGFITGLVLDRYIKHRKVSEVQVELILHPTKP